MSSQQPSAYEFGGFRLLPADRQLLRHGKPVPLKPKIFETLLLLVEKRGHLIEKDEFLKRLWPDSFVEEVALAQNISQLRKILRNGTAEEFIETVPKRGYRFVMPVEIIGEDSQELSSRITLAVLPFENLGADPEHEYLADGLTEELVAAAGQIDPEHLNVIGRTSIMAYKRTTKSLAEIGRELEAGFLVESSIRTEGGRVRIISKLIRVRDQVQIWAASYDSEPSSMLEFQRELSISIAMRCGYGFRPSVLLRWRGGRPGKSRPTTFTSVAATSGTSSRLLRHAVLSSTTRAQPNSTLSTRWRGLDSLMGTPRAQSMEMHLRSRCGRVQRMPQRAPSGQDPTLPRPKARSDW